MDPFIHHPDPSSASNKRRRSFKSAPDDYDDAVVVDLAHQGSRRPSSVCSLWPCAPLQSINRSTPPRAHPPRSGLSTSHHTGRGRDTLATSSTKTDDRDRRPYAHVYTYSPHYVLASHMARQQPQQPRRQRSPHNPAGRLPLLLRLLLVPMAGSMAFASLHTPRDVMTIGASSGSRIRIGRIGAAAASFPFAEATPSFWAPGAGLRLQGRQDGGVEVRSASRLIWERVGKDPNLTRGFS